MRVRVRVEDRRVAVGVGEGFGQRPLGQLGHLGDHALGGVEVDVLERRRGKDLVGAEDLEEVELDVPDVALVVAHRRSLPACYWSVTSGYYRPVAIARRREGDHPPCSCPNGNQERHTRRLPPPARGDCPNGYEERHRWRLPHPARRGRLPGMAPRGAPSSWGASASSRSSTARSPRRRPAGGCWSGSPASPGSARPGWPRRWRSGPRTTGSPWPGAPVGRRAAPRPTGPGRTCSGSSAPRAATTSCRPARPGTPPTERFVRFRAVAARLNRMAAERPALLVLDDAHAVDTAAALLTRFVARSLRAARVLVLVTARDEAPDEVDALLGEGIRLFLTGLADNDVAALLRAQDGSADPERTAELVELTGGNPLYLREALAADRSGAIGSVPGVVRPLLLRRLAVFPIGAPRRPGRGRRARARRSTTPPSPRRPRVDVGTVRTVRDVGRAVGLLRTGAGTEFRFTHGLLREALLDDLGPDAVAQLHVRAAAALAESSTGSAQRRLVARAQHLLFAAAHGVTPVDTAVDTARAAAAAERDRGGHEPAGELLRAAIDLLAGDGRRPARALARTRAGRAGRRPATRVPGGVPRGPRRPGRRPGDRGRGGDRARRHLGVRAPHARGHRALPRHARAGDRRARAPSVRTCWPGCAPGWPPSGSIWGPATSRTCAPRSAGCALPGTSADSPRPCRCCTTCSSARNTGTSARRSRPSSPTPRPPPATPSWR